MQTKKYYTYIQQKCGQKPKAKSQVKPKPKANKSQQKPKKANKSQRPKAKSQVGMQMGNSGSKMQQIARKTAPGWKTKTSLVYIYMYILYI